MFQVLGLPEQAAQTLHESAVAARQAGHLTHAMAAAHQLSSMHTQSATAPGVPAASLSQPAPNLYIASTLLLPKVDSDGIGIACFAVVAAGLSTHISTTSAHTRITCMDGKHLLQSNQKRIQEVAELPQVQT